MPTNKHFLQEYPGVVDNENKYSCKDCGSFADCVDINRWLLNINKYRGLLADKCCEKDICLINLNQPHFCLAYCDCTVNQIHDNLKYTH